MVQRDQLNMHLRPLVLQNTQIEKEGVALIFGEKKFHKLVYGRPFTLVTDHKPLVSIFGQRRRLPSPIADTVVGPIPREISILSGIRMSY